MLVQSRIIFSCIIKDVDQQRLFVCNAKNMATKFAFVGVDEWQLVSQHLGGVYMIPVRVSFRNLISYHVYMGLI